MKRKLLLMITLSMATQISSAQLAPSCIAYFSEYENLLNAIPASESVNIKREYAEVKKQFSSLPQYIQEQSCLQASEKLEQRHQTDEQNTIHT
ncbi:putative TonB-dependent receptor protein [Pasteurella multocida]|nr:putative TonB-dependent receptor protein [Pasteurella multocida]